MAQLVSCLTVNQNFPGWGFISLGVSWVRQQAEVKRAEHPEIIIANWNRHYALYLLDLAINKVYIDIAENRQLLSHRSLIVLQVIKVKVMHVLYQQNTEQLRYYVQILLKLLFIWYFFTYKSRANFQGHFNNRINSISGQSRSPWEAGTV